MFIASNFVILDYVKYSMKRANSFLF